MPQERESSHHDAPAPRDGDEDTVRSRVDERTARVRDDAKDILDEIDETLYGNITEESARDRFADAVVRSYVQKGGE